MRFSGRDPLPWNTMALTYFIPAPLFVKRVHCFENLDPGAKFFNYMWSIQTINTIVRLVINRS